MSATLNGLGHQLFGWLGPLSIELAALALLVLAAGRLIRSPALRHLLWLAVLLKPVAAMAVSSPYTVFAPLAPLAEPGWDAIPHGRVEHLAELASASAGTASSNVTLTPAGWAALLWLVGTTLLGARILVGFGILRRMRRQALVQREGRLFEALRRARAALDCHPRVEVATSPSIRSPMVLGILRPLIIVPPDLVDRLPADQLTLILMHELAHVRRCDNLWLLLQRLVTAALFYHPAVWICGRMLRREAEQACDDLVVCATGRPEAYARGLTLVAEGAAHSNLPARRIPMMSTFASTESDLSQRIRRTLYGRASGMGTRARLLAVVLLSPLAVASLPSYGTADNGAGGEPAPAADSSGAAGSWRKALEEFGVYPDEDMTLGEFTERMRKGMERMQKHQGRRLPEGIKALRTRITVGADMVSVSLEGNPDPLEPLSRAIGEIEHIEREAIERVAAESSDLTEEERLVRILEALARSHVVRKAVGIDPDEWSDELKAQLLALMPDSTIEEIAKSARGVRSGFRLYTYSARGMDRMEPGVLLLMVDQDGNMKLSDKPVTLATLGEELKKQQSLNDSTSMVMIQGDRHVSHAHIVEIMDIVVQAGLVNQVIAPEPPPGR